MFSSVGLEACNQVGSSHVFRQHSCCPWKCSVPPGWSLGLCWYQRWWEGAPEQTLTSQGKRSYAQDGAGVWTPDTCGCLWGCWLTLTSSCYWALPMWQTLSRHLTHVVPLILTTTLYYGNGYCSHFTVEEIESQARRPVPGHTADKWQIQDLVCLLNLYPVWVPWKTWSSQHGSS